MKKIILMTGSPRSNGNTNRMADAFEGEAKKLGHQVVRFDTAFMKINGCKACDCCYKNEKACVFDDDYNKIADHLESADAIVIATPLYWYSFPSQIKAAIDKWYSLYVKGIDFSGKTTALMSTCEDTGIEAFLALKYSYEKSMELLNAKVIEEILLPGVCNIGDIDQTDGIARAKTLAHRI